MNFAESWQHLVPTFNSPAVFIPAFKVSLQAGHFVNVFQDGYFLVGRIIGTAAKLADISIMRTRNYMALTMQLIIPLEVS